MKVKQLYGGAEINPKEFRAWIRALRSGEYKQTVGALQDDTGYCCLGVACKTLVPEAKLERNDGDWLKGELPAEQFNAPEWLKLINADTEQRVGRWKQEDDDADDFYSDPNLSNLNDQEGLSFDEIADVLELIYVHGALEL